MIRRTISGPSLRGLPTIGPTGWASMSASGYGGVRCRKASRPEPFPGRVLIQHDQHAAVNRPHQGVGRGGEKPKRFRAQFGRGYVDARKNRRRRRPCVRWRGVACDCRAISATRNPGGGNQATSPLNAPPEPGLVHGPNRPSPGGHGKAGGTAPGGGRRRR